MDGGRGPGRGERWWGETKGETKAMESVPLFYDAGDGGEGHIQDGTRRQKTRFDDPVDLMASLGDKAPKVCARTRFKTLFL